MKSYKHKFGLTLVEMLVVVGIIAILASMVISIAGRIHTQDKQRLTEGTFALLNAALEQFRDYGYSYKHPDYAGFDFPLDCNELSQGDVEATLKKALDASNVSIIDGEHDPEYSGSEALYFFLSRVPESRKTLDRIDSSLTTDKDSNGHRMKIIIDREYPLLRFIDPWGTTLRYDYYDEDEDIDDMKESRRNFPLITSAGPDKEFGTADDITSR